MKSKIVKRPSQARCYKCGSTEIAQICHHCGRAICTKHILDPQPGSFFFRNWEFRRLMLGEDIDNGERVAAHCEPCRKKYHLPFDRLRFVEVAFIIGLLSLVSGWYLQRLGFFLLSGIFLAGVVLELLIHANDYLSLFGGYAPPLPLIGRIRKANIEEKISGTITLDAERNYSGKVTIPPSGDLKTFFQFTQSAHARYDRYLQKYGSRLVGPVSIHPGYALLHGDNDIELGHQVARPGQRKSANNIISFEDQLDQQRHRFLAEEQSNQTNGWRIQSTYRIGRISKRNGKEFELPVQLVPTFIKQGNKWGITLQIQSNPKARIDYLLEAGPPVVKTLTLRMLVSEAGEVQDVVPPASIRVEEPGRIGQAYNEIEWREITASQGANGYPLFFIRLEKEIDHGDGADEAVFPPEKMQLSGELTLEFKGALSKLEKVTYFSPLGHPRAEKKRDDTWDKEEEVKLSRTTKVDIKFKLCLDSVIGQELVTDQANISSNSIYPDHKMIKSLADNLSKSKFYVKRIIENRPHTKKGNANIMNRYWDISGRVYDQLFPIDFHIIVTGSEYREGFGRTHIEINVQGKASNPQIRDEIVAVKDMLLQRADLILNSTKQSKTAVEMPINFDSHYEVKTGGTNLKWADSEINQPLGDDGVSTPDKKRTIKESNPFDRLSEMRDELSRMSRGIASLQPDLDPIIGMFTRVIGEERNER